MAKEVSLVEPFAGRWRILEMWSWSDDYLHCAGEAYITFDSCGGTLSFGGIEGALDVRYGTRDGSPCAEFSWEGQDGEDALSGRGWLAIVKGTRGFGHFYIHDADDSAFVCKRRRRSTSR
ncbi:MAG: hypothetical protein FWD68_09700 [Alphaproteobacteria bacterium]|nr:hypothetical protein [Alphaproteobacteria bacterium]